MTLTSTYSPETQEYMSELEECLYAVEDMQEFITEHGEENFRKHYEDYVSLGEENDYEAVDEYIQEFGIDNLDSFSDSFKGQYSNFRQFSDELFDEVYLYQIPENVHAYIDYDAFANDLQFDYTMTESGYIFYNY